jgi:hypothetical protein
MNNLSDLDYFLNLFGFLITLTIGSIFGSVLNYKKIPKNYRYWLTIIGLGSALLDYIFALNKLEYLQI